MSALSRSLALALLLVLAGCNGALLPSPTAPPLLYQLAPVPSSAFPAGRPRVPVQLLVDVPVAAAALDTTRIALSRSPTSLDYFADASWTDRLTLVVQSMLAQTLENSHWIGAVGEETVALRGDDVLISEIRHFEADYSGSTPPVVTIEISAKLVKMTDRSIVAQRSFDTKMPAERNDTAAVIDAFNKALQNVAREMTVWTADTLARAPRG